MPRPLILLQASNGCHDLGSGSFQGKTSAGGDRSFLARSCRANFPTIKWLNCRAVGSAIAAAARNPRFKNRGRIRNLFDQIPGNASERDFQAPAPNRICLAGIGADVEVDKALVWRTLHERTEQRGLSFAAACLCSHREFKTKISTLRSLFLDGLIDTAAAFLQTEVDTWWRLFENDPKIYLAFHVHSRPRIYFSRRPFYHRGHGENSEVYEGSRRI